MYPILDLLLCLLLCEVVGLLSVIWWVVMSAASVPSAAGCRHWCDGHEFVFGATVFMGQL